MKTSIRLFAVIFAVAMMVCSFASVSAASYPDVTAETPHASAISTMTNLGILGGYEDGTFRPDGLITRAEMAKIIFVTYTTYTDAGEGTNSFPDVASNYWAKGYISWCAGKQIVGGYEDGTFRPTGNITFNEALKMACAMLGYTDFNSELWPTDVRVKALNELKLGEKLEDVEGDAQLTRAQVSQLIYNTLDKPVYQAPVEPNELGMVAAVPTVTIGGTTWNYEETVAQVIATENRGFKDLENGINATKTEDENKIKVRITYEDETTEDKVLKLSDLALDEYIGNSDSLIALNINLISREGTEGYISADVVGVRKENVTSGYASIEGLSEDEITFYKENKDDGGYARFGVKIDGKDHFDEHFLPLRRLTYYSDGTVESINSHINTSGEVVNELVLTYSKKVREQMSMAFLLTQGYTKYQVAIDKDGDGWYDYIIVEPVEPYIVKTVAKKTVTFESVYGATFVPVTGEDLTFNKEDVSLDVKEGDIVTGYPLGEKFIIRETTSIKTGYTTKYDKAGNKWTINTGDILGGAYYGSAAFGSTFKTVSAAGTIDSFNSSVNPLIGKNSLGQYNYINFWLTDSGKIVWMETVSSEEAAELSSGHQKAVLLYVTEATEPQLNEKTKEYEVYYPAYIVINGRTQLVNLNPAYAINKFSAATVAQDGSAYRAWTVEEDGYSRVMYPNIFVTYSIDSEGYYTLYTDADTITENEVVVEKVIPAGEKYLSIDKTTGILTIKDASDNVIETKIMVDDTSIIYFTYVKDETGSHQYLDYYKGSEIPADFEEIRVDNKIFLTYDEETGLYTLAAAMLNEKTELEGTSSTTVDPAKDAREHLFAVLGKEAVVSGTDIRASYTFKKLYDYSDVTDVNTYKAYDEAADVAMNSVYAWDARAKNYIAVSNDWESVSVDTVSEVLLSNGVLFTANDFATGLKIDETVNIVAVTDSETAETKLITLDELATLYELVQNYNEEKSASETLSVTIGTYEEDNQTKVAYILVDWIEYDEELEEYSFAGVIK